MRIRSQVLPKEQRDRKKLLMTLAEHFSYFELPAAEIKQESMNNFQLLARAYQHLNQLVAIYSDRENRAATTEGSIIANLRKVLLSQLDIQQNPQKIASAAHSTLLLLSMHWPYNDRINPNSFTTEINADLLCPVQKELIKYNNLFYTIDGLAQNYPTILEGMNESGRGTLLNLLTNQNFSQRDGKRFAAGIPSFWKRESRFNSKGPLLLNLFWLFFSIIALWQAALQGSFLAGVLGLIIGQMATLNLLVPAPHPDLETIVLSEDKLLEQVAGLRPQLDIDMSNVEKLLRAAAKREGVPFGPRVAALTEGVIASASLVPAPAADRPLIDERKNEAGDHASKEQQRRRKLK